MKNVNTSTYMKICISFLFLFVALSPLFSETVDSQKKRSEDALNLIVPDSSKVVQQANKNTVMPVGACVNSFENQTVSAKQSVSGCDTLFVRNVTVTSQGDLTLLAPNGVCVNELLEVQSGGVLTITKKQVISFEFFYDASGNRISRIVSD